MASTATALDITVGTNVTGSYGKLLATWFNTATVPATLGVSTTYTYGSGSGQANFVGESTGTISGATDIDINTGGITDAFGQTAALTKVKELIIVNTSTGSGENINVTGDFVTSSLGTITSLTLHPGGCFRFSSPIDGYTANSTTADMITLTPSAGSRSYKLMVIGVM